MPPVILTLGPSTNGDCMKYIDQLRHPNWQRLRLEMLEHAGWECSNCGGKENTLHVHHRQYIKGKMAWEYDQSQLAVFCEACHAEEHRLADELKDLLACVDTGTVLSLVKGFYSQADYIEENVGDAGRDRDPNTYAIGFTASLLSPLSSEDLFRVAKFATDMMREDQEERLIFIHNQYIYKEML